MLRMFPIALFAAMLLIASFDCALADKITVDTANLDKELLAQVLKANDATPDEPLITPEAANEWAQVGKNIGAALGEAAKSMSVEVNEFAKTFVGKLTIVLIVWSVIGQDLWAIVGGSLAWAIVGSIILWSYRRHHFLHPVLDAEGKPTGEMMTRVDMTKDSKEVSMWVHLILFVVLTGVCMVIIF